MSWLIVWIPNRCLYVLIYFGFMILFFWPYLIVYFHFAPQSLDESRQSLDESSQGLDESRLNLNESCQSLSESPQVSPVPGSPAVRATSDEEVEMNPRPTCPLPSSSCSISVANTVSLMEQEAAPDEVLRLPDVPKRTLSPTNCSARRTKRRAECCSRREACLPSPILLLDFIEERNNRVSEVVAAASGWRIIN